MEIIFGNECLEVCFYCNRGVVIFSYEYDESFSYYNGTRWLVRFGRTDSEGEVIKWR